MRASDAQNLVKRFKEEKRQREATQRALTKQRQLQVEKEGEEFQRRSIERKVKLETDKKLKFDEAMGKIQKR